MKLENYGIRGITLKLLTIYLSNRLQYANFKIVFGDSKGLVLGHLLFLIYLNDLINASNNENFLIADDTNISVTGKVRLKCKTKLKVY